MSDRHRTVLRQLHDADRKTRHGTMEAAYGIAERADRLEYEVRRLSRRAEAAREIINTLLESHPYPESPALQAAREFVTRRKP